MIALLLACTPGPITIGGDAADSGGDVEHLPDVDGDDTAEPPPPDPARVFNLDAVHTVELTVADADVRALRGDPYSYVPATVVWDGVAFPEVALRIKGRLGSYRDLGSKTAWKLDFIEYGGEELEGLEKLNLNSMVQDCAQVHELAAYGVFERAAGIPAPRVGYAWVTMNGDDYGLYSVVEDWDDVLLARAWADATGNLYDGDYELWADGSYTLLDFTAETQDLISQSEGEDVGLADVHAVTAALDAAAAGTGTFQEGVGAVIDLDQFARFWATSAWVGQYDSYIYYSNNWRLYFDPADGKGELLPWDPDWAFYTDTPLTTPYSRLSLACQADPTCLAAMVAALGELGTTIPQSGVRDDVEAAIELIDPYLRDDPRKESDMATIRTCQDQLLDWFDTRDALMTRVFGS